MLELSLGGLDGTLVDDVAGLLRLGAPTTIVGGCLAVLADVVIVLVGSRALGVIALALSTLRVQDLFAER